MKTWLVRIATAVLLIILALTVYNASLWAPEPLGSPKLIAHRGIHQQIDRTGGIERDECAATRILPPEHDYFENSIAGIRSAFDAKAQMVEVDVAPTKDGEMVLFHDWTLDCRTNGTGDIRDATLAELKTLDIGHGYSADAGQTFPLRGKGVGLMPTLAEGLLARQGGALMFHFKSKDPAEADLLADILEREGRDPVDLGDGFYGHEAPVGRIRERFPDAWAWTKDEARACSEDYLKIGWTGIVPETCQGRTMIVPTNYQWLVWGWPDRTIARMKAAGTRIIMVGPVGDASAPQGLTEPRQLGEIPASFNGYVWVEKIEDIGPALVR